MVDEKLNPEEISEEITDALAAEEQGESDEFKPENLPAEQREQFEKAVQAIDEFIERHPNYKATDENRAAILDYLAEHDLQISPAALELAFEQLQDSLDLEEETKTPEESVANRVRQDSTGALAREEKTEEPPEESEEEPTEEEEPVGKRGGKVIAFRNTRRVGVGG